MKRDESARWNSAIFRVCSELGVTKTETGIWEERGSNNIRAQKIQADITVWTCADREFVIFAPGSMRQHLIPRSAPKSSALHVLDEAASQK